MSYVASAEQKAELPAFWKSRLSDVDEAVAKVANGTTHVLTHSPGKRPIHLVSYGEPIEKQSRSNYNSACGGGDPAAYARKDGQQRPVVFLLGPVHGGEIEGVVGLVNLLHVAETGSDLRGLAWKELADNLARCRVLIVPSANPDGRARCLYDSWVGEELSTHEPIEMGVRPDGANYRWPDVKRVHPMRPAYYRSLGAYFNDDGINLMHDDWFLPRAVETRALLQLARDEAPDFIVSLHSHASNPSLEPIAYVPRTVKETVKELADRVYRRYAGLGLPHRTAGPEPKEDGVTFPPPSFNLVSALHHVCGGVAFVYESCNGVRTKPYPQVNHDQLLNLQLLFYDELFRYAVEKPVNWVRDAKI
jgi:hypothetical protein